MNIHVLDMIQRAADEGHDVWEMAIAAGIEANDRMDAGRWFIGDLALLVNTEYGQNSIEEFAQKICVEVNRVREYRTTCAFWHRQNSVRTEFLSTYPMLKYSHFRIASKLGAMDAAEQMLRTAAEGGWSTTYLYKQVKSVLKPDDVSPAKIVDTELTIDRISGTRVTFELTVAQSQALFDLWQARQKVRLVVYTVPEAAQESVQR